MIFGIKEKVDNFDPYNIVGYFYKYKCATYDRFCGLG